MLMCAMDMGAEAMGIAKARSLVRRAKAVRDREIAERGIR